MSLCMRCIIVFLFSVCSLYLIFFILICSNDRFCQSGWMGLLLYFIMFKFVGAYWRDVSWLLEQYNCFKFGDAYWRDVSWL
jgi:hypothetical protein